MFRNYVLIAYRNLINKFGYATLNILGLSIGIAGCLVTILFAVDQYSYDTQHANAPNIYRVVSKQTTGNSTSYVALTQAVLGNELRQNFSEIQNSTRVAFKSVSIEAPGKDSFEEKIMAVDTSFFSIYTIPFKTSPRHPLAANEIYLSEAASIKLFGKSNSVGQVVSIPGYDLVVAGIFNDLPYQTHLKTHFIISFQLIEQSEPQTITWSSNSYYNYVLMPDKFDRKEFDKKLDAFIHKFTPESWSSYEYFLQPMLEIHFRPGYVGNPFGSLGKMEIIAFNVVGAIVLILACFNYINLATARSVSRSQEVGVRKVVGARRSQLIFQFLIESFVVCLLALLLGILWADFGVQAFNAFSGYALKISSFFTNPELFIKLILALISLAIIAGAYPAFLLSGFIPAKILKGQYSLNTGKRVRRTLVVVQFTLNTALVLFGVLVYRQSQFIKEYDLGFKQDQMLFFFANRNNDISLASFKAELLRIPGVKQIATSSTHPSSRLTSTSVWEMGHQEEESVKAEWILADHDYIPVLELKLVAGENFKQSGYDSSNVIINEKAAAAFGWTPQEAIGRKIEGVFSKDSIPAEIVGVVKDFHIASLRKELNPLVIGYSINTTGYLVSLDGNDLGGIKDQVDEVGAKFTSEEKFKSIFMEEALESSYQLEKKLVQLIAIFTVLASALGCSGLYALAAYEGERKIKELGIRKIMGATLAQLVFLLSRSMMRPVAISLLIGIPISYALGNFWLRFYPYHVGLSVSTFVASAIVIITIGWTTILMQAIKASRLNPVEALRYE